MNFKKKLIIFIIFLLIPVFFLSAITTDDALSDKKLTFEESLELSKKNSPQYKLAEANRKNTLLSVNVAGDWIPSLNVQSSLYSGAMSFMPNKLSWNTLPSKTLDFTGSATFGISAKNFTDISLFNATKEAADASYNKNIQSIETAIFNTYWTLKGLELSKEAAKKSLENSEITYNNVLEKYNVGRISSLDKANSMLSYTNAQTRFIEANAYYNAALVSFKTLVGLKQDDEFIQEDVPPIKKLSLPSSLQLYNEYLNKSYDVRLSHAQQSSAESAVSKIKWSAYTPSLNATLLYNTSSNGSPEWSRDYKDALSFSLSASMTLDGFIPGTATNNAIKMAETQSEIAKINRQQTERNFLSDIETSRGNVLSYYEGYKASLIALENSQNSYNLTKDSFNAGKSTMESFMNAELALLQAQINLISANVSYMVEVYNLATKLGITYNKLLELYTVNEE